MATTDVGIYNALLQPPKSVADYNNIASQQQMNALNLQSAQQKYAMDQQSMADQAALREATKQFGSDPTANLQGLQRAGLYKPAQEYQKAMYDNQKTQGEIGLNKSKAGEQDALAASHTLDTNIKNHNFQLQKLSGITDPSEVLDWMVDGYKNKVFTPEQFAQGLQRFQQAASQPGFDLNAWKQQAMQGGQAATETLKQQQALQIANQAQAGENSRNAATNATHLQTANIAANASRLNNRDTQAGENLRAGMQPGGGVTPDMETTAQAIANGQLPAPTGMALLNPKNQRVVARVMEINPQYDFTSVSAKKAAATSFTSGPLGNALRSVSTANAHLDQLGELVDALGNKDTQAINRIGNYFATQTGDPKVTNFDSIKQIVGQEVVKAIVAGGGGVGEREEAAKSFSAANSPAQLKGAIQHYRMVMKAQADNLSEQRRAAGLPDSTMPKYNTGGNADLHSQADAILKGK